MIFPAVLWVVMTTCLVNIDAHENVLEMERFGGLLDDIKCMKYPLLKPKFLLYTNGENDPKIVIDSDDANIHKMNKLLVKEKETVVLIHDFYEGCDKPFTTSVRKAYLKQDYQVISVCHDLANKWNFVKPWYRLAVPCIASKIQKVLTGVVVPPEKISIVGMGWGAQTGGAVGNGMKGQLSRIIALDPEDYLFHGSLNQLSPRSALSVVVLITGSPHSLIGFNRKDLATIIFVANDGQHQPGCTEPIIHLKHRCSHKRAYELFVESLEHPSAFMATKCGSWEDFKNGLCEHNDRKNFGKDVEVSIVDTETSELMYFFLTNPSPPFSKDPSPPLSTL